MTELTSESTPIEGSPLTVEQRSRVGPEMAHLIDVWFNPHLSETEELNDVARMMRLNLYHKVQRLSGDKSLLYGEYENSKKIVGEAQDILMGMVKASGVERKDQHWYLEAVSAALRGQIETVRAVSDENTQNPNHRKILATAHLTRAVMFGDHYKGMVYPSKTTEGQDQFNAGMHLLAKEIVVRRQAAQNPQA